MSRNAIATNCRPLACRTLSLLFILALGLSLATGAFAQSKKKKKDDAAATAAVSNTVTSAAPDEDKIDMMISEMLGAWQIGDVEKLHATIADDVTIVNGMWGPPVIGWKDYLTSYQAQRARIQQIRMDRLNTLIRIMGNLAWACYQWDFSGVVDGQQSGARGQTTLVLQKRADKWIIVHNHTSIVQTSEPAAPASVTPQPVPAKP